MEIVWMIFIIIAMCSHSVEFLVHFCSFVREIS